MFPFSVYKSDWYTHTRSNLSGSRAVNILLKALIHTLLFHVCTRVLHALHLVCVYLDAPGCLTEPPYRHHPVSISPSPPLAFLFFFWEYREWYLWLSASCLPEGMCSLWLIRGNPISDCPHQPPPSVLLPRFNTFYTAASSSQTCAVNLASVHRGKLSQALGPLTPDGNKYHHLMVFYTDTYVCAVKHTRRVSANRNPSTHLMHADACTQTMIPTAAQIHLTHFPRFTQPLRPFARQLRCHVSRLQCNTSGICSL